MIDIEHKLNSEIHVRFSQLASAMISLGASVAKPIEEDRLSIDASIRRFIYVFELFWKLLKAILEQKGIEVQYLRDVMQQAYQGHLIDNEEMWIAMLKDRNLTSHTYDKKLADDIFKRIHQYLPVLKSSFTHLQQTFHQV